MLLIRINAIDRNHSFMLIGITAIDVLLRNLYCCGYYRCCYYATTAIAATAAATAGVIVVGVFVALVAYSYSRMMAGRVSKPSSLCRVPYYCHQDNTPWAEFPSPVYQNPGAHFFSIDTFPRRFHLPPIMEKVVRVTYLRYS